MQPKWLAVQLIFVNSISGHPTNISLHFLAYLTKRKTKPKTQTMSSSSFSTDSSFSFNPFLVNHRVEFIRILRAVMAGIKDKLETSEKVPMIHKLDGEKYLRMYAAIIDEIILCFRNMEHMLRNPAEVTIFVLGIRERMNENKYAILEYTNFLWDLVFNRCMIEALSGLLIKLTDRCLRRFVTCPDTKVGAIHHAMCKSCDAMDEVCAMVYGAIRHYYGTDGIDIYVEDIKHYSALTRTRMKSISTEKRSKEEDEKDEIVCRGLVSSPNSGVPCATVINSIVLKEEKKTGALYLSPTFEHCGRHAQDYASDSD